MVEVLGVTSWPWDWQKFHEWKKMLPRTAAEVQDNIMRKNGFQPIMDNPQFIALLKRVLL